MRLNSVKVLSRESCGAGFLLSMLHLFLPFSPGVDSLILLVSAIGDV
jgi:hypothetical protein